MKRVSRACQQCRSKHIKCNGRSPCSRCIAHAELHNITPNEICLYPEPKKRGRPSANTSTHHAHDHHSSSHNSSSVVKKKPISTNKGRVILPPSSAPITTRSSTSPTNNVINLQSHSSSRWQPQPQIVTQSDSIAYWNGNENIQLPYFVHHQLPVTQMSVTRNDLFTRQANLNLANYSDFGYLNPPKAFILNSSPSTNAMISSNSIQNNTSSATRNGNSNNYYRHSYNNSSSSDPHNYNTNTNNNNGNSNNNNNNNNNSYNSTTALQCSTISLSSTNNSNHTNNSTSTLNNSNNSPIISHHYFLNGPYHVHRNLDYLSNQMNLNSFDNFYSNFSNEGSISDSSDSPYSSHTSTPELLSNNPSVSNSPLSEFIFGAGNGLNIGQDSLLDDFPSEESPLLSAAKSEIAYSSSFAPCNTSNCIYPSLLEHNSTTTYVKPGDSRLSYDSIPANINGWIY